MCLHSRITIRSGAYSSNEGDFGQLPLYDTRPRSRGLFLNLSDNRTFEKIAVALSREDIEYIAHLARLEVSEPDVPAYADKLGDDQREALKSCLRKKTIGGPDRPFALTTHAWAVRGKVPR